MWWCRAGWVLCGALVGVGACAQDDSSDDDDIVQVDGGADGGPSDVPRCGDRSLGRADASSSGDSEQALREPHAMVVTASRRGWLELEQDLACDPQGEITASMTFDDAPAEVWIPPQGSQVVARVWQEYVGSYGEVRSPDGLLIWEGGLAPMMGGDAPVRFRVARDPDAQVCTPDTLPADDPCCCRLERSARVWVTTDAGESELGAEESAPVTIEGEPFVAVVVWARDVIVEPCTFDGETGAFAAGYVARTTPIDLPLTEPGACEGT